MFRQRLIGAAALAAIATSGHAMGLEDALDMGGERLSGPQIAERIKGKTARFVAASGAGEWLVYYGTGNEASSRKVGTDSVVTGIHAITDRDQVCIGWEGSDLPNLRCLDVVVIDGVMHKFRADGMLSGHIAEVLDGNGT